MSDVKGEEQDALILSIKLASGNFEMSLRHPFFPGMTEADFKSGIDAWLALSIQAIRSGVESMDATIKETERG